MALTSCHECSHELSTTAKNCPKCGAKPKKKTSVFGWLGLIFFILVGFGIINSKDSAISHKDTVSALSDDPVEIKPKSAWTYFKSEDEMDGSVGQFVTSYSTNILDGWLNDGSVMLGYTCGGDFYARANSIGFHTDDVDCYGAGCTNKQYARAKFDDGEPFEIQFEIWDKNNDGMTLENRTIQNKRINDIFIEGMKKHNKLTIEYELFSTKGRQQLAYYDLTGFTKAIGQCK